MESMEQFACEYSPASYRRKTQHCQRTAIMTSTGEQTAVQHQMKRSEPPPPEWTPSPEFIATTNIAWLMQRAGVDSYEALHAWSVRHREAYWALAIERLGLRFCEPFDRVVDLSHGVEAPRWLPGARLNIVESCFAAHEESPAILYQPEGGKLKVMSYGELEALADRVAANLRRRGYRRGDALAILMPMTAEAVAIYLGIIKAGCVVVGIADSFQPKEIATRLMLANVVAVFTQDVLLRGGKALPLYSNAIEAGAPPAIVMPALDRISLPLRKGDSAWHEFLESPLFPTDLLTGHGPGSAGIRAGEITGCAGKDAGAPGFMEIDARFEAVPREPSGRTAGSHRAAASRAVDYCFTISTSEGGVSARQILGSRVKHNHAEGCCGGPTTSINGGVAEGILCHDLVR
jgi:hypothetical protein